MTDTQSIAAVDGVLPQRTRSRARARPAKQGPSRSVMAWLGLWLFSLLIAVSLYLGWQIRAEGHLTAEKGLGYALGITGGVMMLLLLGYPLRKRMRALRNWGSMAGWFRAHMLLGVLGPVLILFHCNFSFGSANSNVALIATLLVAVSGLAGRYIYIKIHYGLYGRRTSLKELREAVEDRGHSLAAVFEFAPELEAQLHDFEGAVMAPRGGLLTMPVRLMAINSRTRRVERELRRLLKLVLSDKAERLGWGWRERRRHGREARRLISAYLATIRRVARFSFFERLFSLWHVLHVPLFFILVIASVVHVVAVHWY